MASPAPAKKSKRTPARELDTAAATRGIWLVKVPKYLADVWAVAEPDTELGRMRISSSSVMNFTLSEDLALQAGKKIGLEIPKEHRVLSQDTTKQSLNIFSEMEASKELSAEGKVTQKADLQPVNSASYMKLKQYQIKEAGRTRFNPVMKLDRAPVNKPTKEVKVPKQLDKRARDDKEIVLDLIFSAFQAHEFYTFNDLVYKTKQPPTYLKEILKEVCLYNNRAPHKNTWQLKPEYKHYKTAAKS